MECVRYPNGVYQGVQIMLQKFFKKIGTSHVSPAQAQEIEFSIHLIKLVNLIFTKCELQAKPTLNSLVSARTEVVESLLVYSGPDK